MFELNDSGHVEEHNRLVSRALSLNVKDYGAMGDGVTDDTAAIAAAIAALPELSVLPVLSNVLHFPAGDYLHSGVIIDGLSHFEIHGPGQLVAATAHQTQYVTISNCTDFRVVGLKSRHQTPTARRDTPARAFSVQGCARFSLLNLHAHNGEGIGIMLTDCSYGAVTSCRVNDTKADGIGLYNDTHHVTVTGCITTDTGDDGIAQVGVAADVTGPHNNVIIGNVIERSLARGIAVVGASDTVISGNIVDITKAGGIYVAQESSRDTRGCNRVLVDGNVVRGANTLEPAISQAALFVFSGSATYPVEDVTFSKNVVTNTQNRACQVGGTSGTPDTRRVAVTDNHFNGAASGLLFYQVEDLHVSGNRFNDIDGNVIFGDAGALGVITVTNNVARDVCNDAPTAAFDLDAATSVLAMLVTNNVLVDSLAATYGYDLPASCVAYGNVDASGKPTRGGNGDTDFRGNLRISSAAAAAGAGTGTGVLAIRNASAAPSTNPSNGGVVFVEDGALKFRGSSGTVTIIAPA